MKENIILGPLLGRINSLDQKITSVLLPKKADLGEDGKIKASQLPEFVIADVIRVNTYSDLPATGDSGKVYYVENDPDATKNGSYRWVGDGYFKYTSEANYYSVSIVGDTYTMGKLEETVNDINTSSQHVFFDLHNFIPEAYVCLAHFATGKKCEIFDLLNIKAYGIGQVYTDNQLVSNYVTTGVVDFKQVIHLTHETWEVTLEDESTIDKEVVLWNSGT